MNYTVLKHAAPYSSPNGNRRLPQNWVPSNIKVFQENPNNANSLIFVSFDLTNASNPKAKTYHMQYSIGDGNDNDNGRFIDRNFATAYDRQRASSYGFAQLNESEKKQILIRLHAAYNKWSGMSHSDLDEDFLEHKAPTAFFEGLIWQQQYTKNGITYKGAGLSFMTKKQSEAVASGNSSITESIGPYIYEVDKIPSKAQLSAEMVKEITANCINRGVIISPKESKKAIDAFYSYLTQNSKSAERHTVKHSDEPEDDDDVIDCTEEYEDVLEHKDKSNLVRLHRAWYDPSHDYNSPVNNILNEDYNIYQKPDSGWFEASFYYPEGAGYNGYNAASVMLFVTNGTIRDTDNGVQKPLTLQNLKQMILHAVTIKLSSNGLVKGMAIDDATAARAAAQAWADMQDDIAKINGRKRREANTSGKFEKNDSGKRSGSRIRKQFMIQHSAYTVIPSTSQHNQTGS